MQGNYITSNSSNNTFKSMATTSLNVPLNLISTKQNGNNSLFGSRRESNGHKLPDPTS